MKTGAIDYKIESSTAYAYSVDGDSRLENLVVESEYSSAAKDVVWMSATASSSNVPAVKGGYEFKGYFLDSAEEVAIGVKKVGGSEVNANSEMVAGFYSYTENSDGTLSLTKLVKSDGVYNNATTYGSLVDNLLVISGTDKYTGAYDATDALVVDLTDLDEKDSSAADYNAYNREITSLSALKRAAGVDYVTGISLAVYADDDAKVVKAIFILKVSGKSQDASIQATADGSITVTDEASSNKLTGTNLSASIASSQSEKTITITLTNSQATNKKVKETSKIEISIKANDSKAKIGTTSDPSSDTAIKLTFKNTNGTTWELESPENVYVKAEDGTVVTYPNTNITLIITGGTELGE